MRINVSRPTSNRGRRSLIRRNRGHNRGRTCLIACVAALVVAGGWVPPARGAEEKPVAGKDHWHAAYGVFICDRFLPPVASSGNDPTGVHTHGDGLIHIHPFVAASAGANAVLARFFEVEPLKVTADSIKVGAKTYKSGGRCGSKSATVRTMIWDAGKTKSPKTMTGDPSKLRMDDQMTFTFVYAPADTVVGLPPSHKELSDPADLPPPPLSAEELTKLPAPPSKIPEPVLPAGAPPTKTTTRDLVVGTGLEAKTGTRVYVRYRATLWNGSELDATSWVQGTQPAALPRLGRGRMMAGLEKGLRGMKVGGIRQIIIPPADGLGESGGVVKSTDTLIFMVQLVAVSGLTNATTT